MRTNFARYLETECRYPGNRKDGFDTGERHVQIGVFPVGVEVEAFNRLARRSLRSSFVSGVLASLSGRAMIIGVDRLDYSKGIGFRLDAFERFLAANPEWRNNVTYLQITPKSRSEHPRICRYGTQRERAYRPHQRHLWRSVVDADPLRQPRA